MARTHDPHAAALKAWETRKRAQQGAGNVAVQMKGDFAQPAPKPKGVPVPPGEPGQNPLLRPWGTSGAPKVPDVERLIVMRAPHTKMTPEEAEHQASVTQKTKEGMRDIEIPAGSLDGLTSIEMSPAREFEWHGPAGDSYRRKGHAPHADYQGQRMRVRVNCDHFANRSPARIAKSVSHEIGHHVHMSRLTDEAAEEWSRLSHVGNNCHISSYGRSDASEHFSDAFAAYSREKPMPDDVERGYHQFHRAELRRLEPETHAFMERLFRNPSSMMRPNGQTKYEARRTR